MAFLGDFGKFFGLGSSEQVLGQTGEAVGSLFGPEYALAGRELGKTTARATNNLAGTADQPATQSALPTPPQRRGIDGGFQESPQSGNQMQNQAFLGSLAPLIQGAGRLLAPASRFLQSPTGNAVGIATGVGSVINASMGSGSRERPVLTQSRRNKSKVRQLVNFMGIEGTSDFLSQQGGQNVSPNDVVALLLRTFRNDGAYITKAQVRNLRRTTNRFKSLEKQVKEATSMSRTTRRTPVRRSASSTTLIRN
jgi:hypothetical protein